jgi:hypothetical protein
MIGQLAAREHKWGLYAGLSAAASAAGLYAIFRAHAAQGLPDAIGMAAVIGAAMLNGFTFNKMRVKNRSLKKVRDQLDAVVGHDLYGLDFQNIGAKASSKRGGRSDEASPLAIYDAAGFFGRFDRIHHLHGYGPQAPEAGSHAAPQMLHSRLTRTETEHYRDAQGRAQQRRRTVEVFHGLLMTLEVPGESDDSRIIIGAGRAPRPRGPFERVNIIGGKTRRQKLNAIKTSSLKFNRLYKVSGDDQMETHEFLDPDRIMRFLNLNDDLLRIFKGRKKVPLFMLMTRGKAYIALHCGPMQPLDDFIGRAEDMPDQIRIAAGQLTLPHIIAEHLKLIPPRRYEWDKDIVKEEIV